MKSEQQIRLSLIDGATEVVPSEKDFQTHIQFEPVLEEFVEQVLTLDGLEQIVRKRIMGFRERT